MLTEPDSRAQTLRDIIQRSIRTVLMDDDETAAPFALDDQLVEIGLNSLMFAALLVDLELETGVDPFAEGEVSVTDMHSVRDLTQAYLRVMQPAASGS